MLSKQTREEIRRRTEKVAIKCYYKIMAEENKRRSETCGKTGLTVLQRLDLYQGYRDKAFSKIGNGMFFEDYYDLFDQIYGEVSADIEWKTLIAIQGEEVTT